jgi:phospho-N-acetylmuramoyl-pentapeptide-transferase
MLYHLLYPLSEYFSPLNVFRYITFRAAYATVTALLISFLVGPWLISQLRARRIGQQIREDGPETHRAKAGTPTMGGILIVLATVLPTLLWADLSSRYVQMAALCCLALGLLGFLDDYLHVVKRLRKGLLGRYKLLGQLSLGAAIASGMVMTVSHGDMTTATTVPFLKNARLDLGLLFIPFAMLVITGTSNAVNLADGLDGLAVGLMVPPAAVFAGLAYVSGHSKFAEYLNIPYFPGSGELTVFCAALMGACLGFLWFNAHPADVFMGDTGSLALGGSLGTVAVLLKREFLLVIVGGIFVAEALSVMIQVASFRTTGRRVFLMAPLHHHFERRGWAESRVVIRFWIIAILLALLSLSTLKLQ